MKKDDIDSLAVGMVHLNGAGVPPIDLLKSPREIEAEKKDDEKKASAVSPATKGRTKED